MKSVRVRLNPSSIGDAIALLKKYHAQLADGASGIREAVADKVAEAVASGFNGARYDVFVDGDSDHLNVRPTILHDQKKSFVTVSDYRAVFVEFGAGVYFNGPVGSFPHPNTPPEISAIGTFGKGYGSRKAWAFIGGDGIKYITHGTPASMPMYHAVRDIADKLPTIVAEVFNNIR